VGGNVTGIKKIRKFVKALRMINKYWRKSKIQGGVGSVLELPGGIPWIYHPPPYLLSSLAL